MSKKFKILLCNSNKWPYILYKDIVLNTNTQCILKEDLNFFNGTFREQNKNNALLLRNYNKQLISSDKYTSEISYLKKRSSIILELCTKLRYQLANKVAIKLYRKLKNKNTVNEILYILSGLLCIYNNFFKVQFK